MKSTTIRHQNTAWSVYRNGARVYGHDDYENCLDYINYQAPRNPLANYHLLRTPNHR